MNSYRCRLESPAGPSSALRPAILAAFLVAAATGAAAGSATSLAAQSGGAALDTVQAGRFDNGRMWTFDTPPVDYFEEAYGFRPDEAWFARARLGALRIPGCSASFVSPDGLVLTNHHCARDHVSAVSQEGETLLDDGFYAEQLADERRIDEFEADQLVEIRDVTDEVASQLAGITDDAARSEARTAALEGIESRILDEFGGEDGGHAVEMISLYNGGRHSAYVFRRYTDVRLVMAPELQMGYFGGDPDNFTYPRYSLDFSLLRVYAEDGSPLDTSEHFFRWSTAGVSAGDPIFVVGNPGSTSRIQTVAELEFRRDVSDKGLLDFLDSRIEALQEFYELDPEAGEALDLRNETFSLLNSQKAYRGILAGLHDPVILAKKRDYEAQFAAALASDESLAEYRGLIERMAEIQRQKEAVAPGFGSFLAFTTPQYASALLTRAMWAFQYAGASAAGMDQETLDGLKESFLEAPSYPSRLDEILIEARLNDLIRNYGESNPAVQQLLAGRTAEGAAAVIVEGSVLGDSAAAAAALEAGSIGPTDPGLAAIRGMLPLIGSFQQTFGALSTEEQEIAIKLGEARFKVYGFDVPPDATFSLRIADGIVDGFDYNGTTAPVHTTFYGMYDRHHSFGGNDDDSPWRLPERWLDPPASFDLSTPFNFVATADIIGGNSGSPVLNRDLELVGVAFDGNISSLPGEYIFLTEFNRTVSVDARGMLEALTDIYQAERIVEELTAGATR